MIVAPDAGWWTFTPATPDWLSTPHSLDFRNNEFTLVSKIRPANVPIETRHIIGKWENLGSEYRLRHVGPHLYSIVSKDGIVSESVSLWNALGADIDSTTAMTYKFIGDGTSQMSVYADGNENVKNDMIGPPYPGTAPFSISGSLAGYYFSGRQYWCAYYDKVLTKAELDTLWNETKHPYEYNPIMYIDFHRAVAATYDSEIPVSEDYLFNVLGSPVHGGSSEPSIAIQYIAEILVGSEVIWSAADDISQRVLTLDVARFTGEQLLTFRIRDLGVVV